VAQLEARRVTRSWLREEGATGIAKKGATMHLN
jgi:hypothetical protein